MNPNYKKKITKLLSISQLVLNKIATIQNLSIAFCNNELTKKQNITISLSQLGLNKIPMQDLSISFCNNE
jgi:hypothetical protein